jgi:zinc transporter
MHLIDTSYGSNEHGLIWGYRFVPGQAAEAISTADVAAFLDTPGAPGFLWLHFSLSNQGAERYLHGNLSLPQAFFDTLHSSVGSTRLEQEDAALIAVIHDVLFDSSFDATDVGTTSLCVGPRMLVSARLRPLRSVDQLRASVRAGNPFRSPIALLSQLLQDQANVLSDIVRKSTTRVDSVEDNLLAERISADRRQLGAMRRSLVRLQRLLAPEPTALFRLLNRPPAWIAAADVQDLQQAAEEFSTAIGDSAALVERIRLIQEELAALANEQTGRTLFVLTVVTVLALPINLVAGLLGMNVGGLPLSGHRHGFALIVTGLVVLTGLLAYVAFGRGRRD